MLTWLDRAPPAGVISSQDFARALYRADAQVILAGPAHRSKCSGPRTPLRPRCPGTSRRSRCQFRQLMPSNGGVHS
jgi:hypothetical protein